MSDQWKWKNKTFFFQTHVSKEKKEMIRLRFLVLVIVFICPIFAATQIPILLELDCKQDEQFTTKTYLPNLITISRLSGGQYSADLRCQAKTLGGISIQNDYLNIKKDFNASLEQFGDGNYAKYVSMSCGRACFNPVISEQVQYL